LRTSGAASVICILVIRIASSDRRSRLWLNWALAHGQARCSVEFYERPDSFDAEYDLTSGGELVYLCLQLTLVYMENGLKRIFHTIDPE